MFASMFAAPGIPIVLLIAALLIIAVMVMAIRGHGSEEPAASRPQQIIPTAGPFYDIEGEE